MKLRLDKAMVERRIAPTRARAQESIASGLVAVEREVIRKTGHPVDSCQSIELLAEGLPYVSRGGLKLAAALDAWNIDVTGRICLDVGISTGGFTDCLLQRGWAHVTGIDSGHGQLAEALRSDPRLRLVEGKNARYLQPEDVAPGTSLFCMDVSFIAASLVLPAVIHAAFPPNPPNGAGPREAVVLVKPQYEAGREFVGKRGIVKSGEAHQAAIERVRQTVCAHGALETSTMDSPVMGSAGNREFLLYARF
jgi:23S rRNA (cytidine1920-2'-O)/16S rRNA (cytidine1409-2'-O)-methyltransferase